MTPARGEVWWCEVPDAGRRPVLVMTRDRAIPVLGAVLAIPITRTIRRIPSELVLGPDDGLLTDCCASFDNVRVIAKATLVERMCVLGPGRMAEACAALRFALDC